MGCNEHKPKGELIRVVRSPEGEISLDFTGKKNGQRRVSLQKRPPACGKPQKAIGSTAYWNARFPTRCTKRWRGRLTAMGTPDRTLGALGLCAKARALVCGTPMVCEALAGRRKPMLAVLAADNSAATDKRLEDKCRYYGVPTVRIAQDGEALARAVGKSGRLAAVAITDENLCRLVRSTLDTRNENHNA